MHNPAISTRMRDINNTLLAFSTPIRHYTYPNVQQFNVELAQRILAMRQQSPGVKVSNVGGWQSDHEFLQKLGEPMAGQLGRMFLENVKAAIDVMVETTEPFPAQMAIGCWANVNMRGDTNLPHIHSGSAWSGVYYVATDPEAGGEINFMDPRPAALMISHPLNVFHSSEGITVQPVPGLMLVFPSFIFHSVYAYRGNSPRISVAFNIGSD